MRFVLSIQRTRILVRIQVLDLVLVLEFPIIPKDQAAEGESRC
jgi:hypothetical protein